VETRCSRFFKKSNNIEKILVQNPPLAQLHD